MPAISIHMDLSVGVPVKNLEKLDATESMATMPNTTRAMPPTSKAMEMDVFTVFLQSVGEMGRIVVQQADF